VEKNDWKISVVPMDPGFDYRFVIDIRFIQSYDKVSCGGTGFLVYYIEVKEVVIRVCNS
jgi:hypothetical protein